MDVSGFTFQSNSDSGYNVLHDTTLDTSAPPGGISYSSVLANDTVYKTITYPGGTGQMPWSSKEAVIATQPEYGTVTMRANGTFVITPNAGFMGPNDTAKTMTFSYRTVAVDGTTRVENPVATTVTVTVKNTMPAGMSDTYLAAR